MSRPTILALALAALTGCEPAASPADPAAAQQALTRALDAWKKGDAPESLATASPSITVADQQWQKGAKLLEYVVAEKSAASGFDQSFTVTLTLDDPAGKKTQKAAYSVSTHPKLVVVRAEGP